MYILTINLRGQDPTHIDKVCYYLDQYDCNHHGNHYTTQGNTGVVYVSDNLPDTAILVMLQFMEVASVDIKKVSPKKKIDD